MPEGVSSPDGPAFLSGTAMVSAPVEEMALPRMTSASKDKLSWVVRDKPRDLRLEKLSAMYNNPRLSDIVLKARGGLDADPGELRDGQVALRAEPEGASGKSGFYASKAFLSTWSPVFDSIFFGEHPETFGEHLQRGQGEDGELLVDCAAEVLRDFLQYIHHGEVRLTIGTIWPFYCFLNTYQVQDLIDSVEDIMDKAVSVSTCCTLLASAQQLGSYDHYALRKCLNMLLMDFPEVAATPSFQSLDYDVLAAVLSSDELNASEECVFEACMEWIAADENRIDLYLDDLLGLIRVPLMDTKYVATLDTHPIASRSPRLQDMMLTALKFAVAPKEVSVAGNPMFRQRKGGLYWKRTKNNMCLDISSPSYKTFVLNSNCNLVTSWKLKVELFEEHSSVVVGVVEETADTGYYVGRFKDGWGLADNGHFYNGGCKCDPSVRHLCTPLCQGHMTIQHGAVITVAINVSTNDIVFRQGQKMFTQRLKDVNPDRRLYPAVSLKAAKARIFPEDQVDIMD